MKHIPNGMDPACICLAAFKGRMVSNFGYVKIVCNPTPNWEGNNCSWLDRNLLEKGEILGSVDLPMLLKLFV